VQEVADLARGAAGDVGGHEVAGDVAGRERTEEQLRDLAHRADGRDARLAGDAAGDDREHEGEEHAADREPERDAEEGHLRHRREDDDDHDAGEEDLARDLVDLLSTTPSAGVPPVSARTMLL
jgi:hypothetical protein